MCAFVYAVSVCVGGCSGEEDDCSPNTPVAPQLSLWLLITLLQSSLSHLRLAEEKKLLLSYKGHTQENTRLLQ